MMSGGLFAQNVNNHSKASKKKERKERDEKRYSLIKQSIENKAFVLEADNLRDRYGNRAFVSSNINFVSVDSTIAVIQIGSNSHIGPNGVGGVTAKGQVSNWKLKENKKTKSFLLSFTVMTNIGIYDLHFTIGGTYATARLTGLRAGELTFEGQVVPIEDSSVFEGQSL